MNAEDRTSLARRLARRCREIVDDLLFDWEVYEIDRELFEVIFDELQHEE